uniref:PAS domain-containing sensor histidine kinase n=1 Tax=uncultured Caulobacter sp. TaxID=158749 RepID=UPI0025CC79FF|nr:PAS domain-containing sensor histidine kinase [uncultured Caulobacter sp.]
MKGLDDPINGLNPAIFALDALTAGVTMLNADGRVVAINEAFADFMRQNALGGEPRGMGADYLGLYAGIVAPEDIDAVAVGIQRLLFGTRGPFRYQFKVRAPHGLVWIKLAAVRVGLPQAPFVMVTHEEITSQRRAQEALQEATARLLHAEDDERRRIARELHDSTAQYLTGAKLLASQLVVAEASEAAKAQVDALLRQCLEEIRSLTYLLHPPNLEQFGLAGAIRHLADGFAQRTGMSIALEIAPTFPRLRHASEIALYRVTQEALSNAHRHANSQKATLGLRLVDDMVLLTVRDYGVGIRPSPAPAAPGVGLSSMRLRLQLLNGRLELNDAQPGLRIEAWAPITGR